MQTTTVKNPLGTDKISRLILRFAVPSIIAMVVGACYNIVDQLFIGNIIGELGNAATNVVYPLTNLCLAFGIMLGIGGSAAFNLNMGAGRTKIAPFYFRNAMLCLFLIGGIILAVVEIFCIPILNLCGSPESVLPYAEEYLRITAIGFPFFVFSAGAGHLLRADGSPNLLMITNIIGAVINIGLDALFMMVFGLGMAGAAWATIIGQFVAAMIQLVFLLKPKTVKMEMRHFIPRPKYFGKDAVLGLAAFVNHIAMMIVHVVLNNTLNTYGEMSIYGAETSIAVAGIVSKVSTIFAGVIIGLSQGSQPIWSFNYGAENYRRVKEAYYRALLIAFIISIMNFALYQLFPDFILGLFGSGSEGYFAFGRMFFRRYLFFVCLFFIQMLTSNFFTAIGKPMKGMFLSLTRQIIYLLPLMIILPQYMGIEGIVYAQPIADAAAIITSIIMIIIEFRHKEFRDEKGVLREIFTRSKKTAQST